MLEYTTLRKVTQATEIFYDPDPVVRAPATCSDCLRLPGQAAETCSVSGRQRCMSKLCWGSA